MRVMLLIKATEQSEAGVLPDESAIAAMGRFQEALTKAGVLLGGEGLQPSSKGKRLVVSGKRKKLVDGPFAEAKELVGGYLLLRVGSMREAVEWCERCADHMPDGEWVLELRPLFEADDFGAALTPELRARDEAMRAEVERQKKR